MKDPLSVRACALAALSYLDGFRVMAILLLAAVPFVWIMKKFKSPPQEQAERGHA